MNKKIKGLIAVALVIAIVSTFFGCKKQPINNNTVNAQFDDFLVVEKIGNINRNMFNTAEGGIYYKDDNGLYGIQSYEGLYDTGAIYATCIEHDKYFAVSKIVAKDAYDIAGLNSVGLVDCKGKVIVPMSYADVDVLNERFVKATAVTEMTYSKDSALIFFDKDGGFSIYPDEDDYLYKGVWYVYDLTTGEMVKGATGTNSEYVTARGNTISFTDDAGNKKTLLADGSELTGVAKIMEDVSYTVEEREGTYYDKDGKALFTYNLQEYIPYDVNNDNIISSKYTEDGYKYVVMDRAGKVISAEFDEYIYVYGDVIKCGNKIYNFEGKNLIDGEYTSIYYDKMFGKTWMLYNDDAYTMIDKDGGVYFAGVYDDDSSVSSSDFVASKKIDDVRYFYSHKDQDYTIEGSYFAPWIVKTEGGNYLYNLVDTMSGETLLEGYSGYSYTAKSALSYYVYAKYNGGADVYLVVANSQLDEVAKKKTNLLDDLIAAFDAEGIKVTINKETGEMLLDSSVLFGGDSAVLTDEGKTFLNKFIKVYTTVAFSDKYAGFISKTMIEGHTAPISGSTYEGSLPLSQERADNVKNYCLSAETGVNVSNIANTLEAVGYSNSQPVYGADGNVDLDASRRVSFRFLVNIDI